jgi:mRNA interferase MazF
MASAMNADAPVVPKRGEIWLADLSPTRGREQAGNRPVLVLSVDDFNLGPAELVIVAPITTTIRGIPSHVVVKPPEGGLSRPSAVLCDAVRSISKGRLVRTWGRVSSPTLDRVEDCLRILMGL